MAEVKKNQANVINTQVLKKEATQMGMWLLPVLLSVLTENGSFYLKTTTAQMQEIISNRWI